MTVMTVKWAHGALTKALADLEAHLDSDRKVPPAEQTVMAAIDTLRHVLADAGEPEPLPPSPETVVVVDANTAHALIGRSIGGYAIGVVQVRDDGFSLMTVSTISTIARCYWGESVSLDPLPAPPPEEEVARTVTGTVRDHLAGLIWTHYNVGSHSAQQWANARAALAAEGGA